MSRRVDVHGSRDSSYVVFLSETGKLKDAEWSWSSRYSGLRGAWVCYQSRAFRHTAIIHADCFKWLGRLPENTLHAIVTDPPYGVKEYDFDQLEKKDNGNGGIWWIPPSFDGHVRSPLPRFTALNKRERDSINRFPFEWGKQIVHVLPLGDHVILASNSFLSQPVFGALVRSGLEFRGKMIRLVRTMRGGGRPKSAEDEFPDVCSMPSNY